MSRRLKKALQDHRHHINCRLSVIFKEKTEFILLTGAFSVCLVQLFLMKGKGIRPVIVEK